MRRTFVEISIVVLLALVAVGGGYYLLMQQKPITTVAARDPLFGWKFPENHSTSTQNLFDVGLSIGGELAFSSIRDPGGVPSGLPMRLQIPSIGVDATVEDALVTSDGKMDVPAGSVNVAWFALGPRPGEVGSAVIGGHYGISDGIPFVFYKLDQVKVGDRVYVLNDKNDTLTFVVRSIKLFDRTADATEVFTSTDGLAHLNVITCEGTWNQVNGLYDKRRVVFTDLVPTSTSSVAPVSALPLPPAPPATFTRSLGLGNSGQDVVALQSALEEKGFLMMPAGVAKGYFGTLTVAAIATYQANRGLPSVGIFGPQTRAALVAELGVTTALPNTGSQQAQPPVELSLTAPQESSPQFVGQLFSTPLNTLITILLLAGIVFMTYTIVVQWRHV